MKLQIFLFLFLAALVSCNTTKNTTTTAPEGSESYKKVLGGLDNITPNYKSMSSPIKLDADIGDASYRASGEIRHVRNEGVYISVKKLGFEIGHVLITQDSFFVLNRWEKEYIREPIAIVEKEYQIRGEFEMVEELLTGLPQFKSYKKNDISPFEAGRHRVELESLYDNIGLTMWLGNNSQPVEQAVYADDYDRGVRMKYQSAQTNKLVVERELHTVNIDDEIHVKLEYRNPEFNKTTLPTFQVPSHYTRRSL